MDEPKLVYDIWLDYLPPHQYRAKAWDHRYITWMTKKQAKRVESWIEIMLHEHILNPGSRIREIGYPSTFKEFMKDFEKDNGDFIGPREWLP